MATAPLLILWHSRTGASEALARSAAAAAGEGSRMLRCEAAEAKDLLQAKGYLFCAPENLAGLSGAMKEMFDRLYYPLLGSIEGRGYATIIAAGSDGAGAERQLDRIVAGWRLRRVADTLIVNVRAQTPEAIMAHKQVALAALQEAATLGTTLAEGLGAGIF